VNIKVVPQKGYSKSLKMVSIVIDGRQWLVILVRRQRSGGSRFKTSLGKWFTRLYLKKAHHKKELV
jgi:hypothetical protein